jgi:hypothetical protein
MSRLAMSSTVTPASSSDRWDDISNGHSIMARLPKRKTMGSKPSNDQYSDEEATRRMNDALRRALTSPPKPHSEEDRQA